MTDEDHKRVEDAKREMDAIDGPCDHRASKACWQCYLERHVRWCGEHVDALFAIIDKKHVATCEDVDRVKTALHDAGCVLPGCRGLVDDHRISDGVRCETLARAALRAMGHIVDGEGEHASS